jgi:hypothetical protein
VETYPAETKKERKKRKKKDFELSVVREINPCLFWYGWFLNLRPPFGGFV